MLTSFLKNEAGVTALEYCLIGLCVFLAAATAIFLMSDSLTNYLSRTMSLILEALG